MRPAVAPACPPARSSPSKRSGGGTRALSSLDKGSSQGLFVLPLQVGGMGGAHARHPRVAQVLMRCRAAVLPRRQLASLAATVCARTPCQPPPSASPVQYSNPLMAADELLICGWMVSGGRGQGQWVLSPATAERFLQPTD